MKKLLTALAIALFLVAPSHAACVKGLEGSDRVIAQLRATKHVLAGQRLLAFVDLMRERVPTYTLEADTTAVWLLELPDAPIGFIVEIGVALVDNDGLRIKTGDGCVTFKPEEIPLGELRNVLGEISRRVVES
jgi:hypothetical protein